MQRSDTDVARERVNDTHTSTIKDQEIIVSPSQVHANVMHVFVLELRKERLLESLRVNLAVRF